MSTTLVILKHKRPINLIKNLHPGEGNGNPLQYSCLGNSMDRRAWQAFSSSVAAFTLKIFFYNKEFPAGPVVRTPNAGGMGLIPGWGTKTPNASWLNSSVQFSRSAVSDSLRLHGLQHTRPPFPSLTPRVYWNSCPLSQWCHPTISSSVIPFSSHFQAFPARSFSNESVLHIRWPKYWSFSFSISPSDEYSALISFRMDWLDLLAVQGTLKSLLQHHSSKASILLHPAFLRVQLLHPHMTIGKTIALTRWTSGSKVMSLLLNMLSGLVITFLPRSKCLLISWLQSPSAVILEPKKIVCHCFPIYLPWSDGTGCHDLSFLNVEC